MAKWVRAQSAAKPCGRSLSSSRRVPTKPSIFRSSACSRVRPRESATIAGSQGKLALVAPHAAPGADHHVGIFGLAQRSVIATQRAKQVPFFTIEVVLQDDTAVAKVVAQTEQVIALAADQSHPEGHDLHVASGTRARYGVFAKIALDLDHRQHELWVKPGAVRLEVHGAQELHARLEVWHSRFQAMRHFGEPVDRRLRIGKGMTRRRLVRDRRLQARPYLDGERFVDLGSCESKARERYSDQRQAGALQHEPVRSGASGSPSGTFFVSLSSRP